MFDIFIATIVFISIAKINKFNEVLIILSVLFLIILNGLIILKRCNRIKRIDIIYSNDFSQIFIGLVKYYEISYKNSFIFDINSIEKFVFDPYKNSKNKCILKIVLRSEGMRELFILENDNDNINKLLLVLNEKINLDEKESLNSIN